MKTPKKQTRKRAPKKARKKTRGPAPKPKSELSVLTEMVAGMTLEQFTEFLGANDPDDLDDFTDDTAADLFEHFLNLSRLGDPNDEDLEQVVETLTVTLAGLYLAVAAGSREARDERDDFLALVEDAANDETLTGHDFMMIAKIMSDAGWRPPESLKRASAASLEGPRAAAEIASLDPGTSRRELTAALMELLKGMGGDEFGAYTQLTSMLSAFPADVAASLLRAIAEDGTAEVNLALAGFALHPDAVIAAAALETLAANSGRAIESRVVERLVRMRPWAPEAQRQALDAAIRALRPKAGPPVAHKVDQLRKVQMTACDGSGAHNLIFAIQSGRRHDACAVLIKAEGVADLMFIDDVGKTGADDLFNQLRATTAASESDLAGAQEMLSVALADNLASNTPPPYNLVRLAERLGLGPLTPDPASTIDIAEKCLSDARSPKRDEATRLKAHRKLIDDDLAKTWFEAGEAVFDLLEPLQTTEQRLDVLMTEYWPGRRAYWARVCAISALALRGPAAGRPAPNHYEHAIVALDLLSETPIENLPLMEAIATATVDAFERNL